MSEERRGVQVTPDSAARRSFLQTAALGGGLLAGGLAAPSPALAQGGGEDVLQKVIKSKQINIAVVIYPPLTIKQGNELAGTFVEAARWLAKQMDAQPNFIESEFGTFIAAIQSGRADIASREECCAGLTGRFSALGPSPLPEAPWQEAHHFVYSCAPSAGLGAWGAARRVAALDASPPR